MTEEKLINEVGEWAAFNFTYHNPWRGLVEEVGELARALLKRDQGIRGYTDPTFFHEKFFDAVGDIGVYAAHYAYLSRQPLYLDDCTRNAVLLSASTHDSLLRELTKSVSQCEPGWGRSDGIVLVINNTAALCAKEGGKMNQVVYDTWAGVKKRNWRKNPVDADKVAAQPDVIIPDLEKGEIDGRLSDSPIPTFYPGDMVITFDEHVGQIANVDEKGGKAVVHFGSTDKETGQAILMSKVYDVRDLRPAPNEAKLID